MFDKLRNFLFERDVNGAYWYTTNSSAAWQDHEKDNLLLAQNHPLLTPGLLFIANLFAQGRFTVINSNTQKPVKNHWVIQLLKNPNYFQTQIDLLESMQFVKLARGYVVLYSKKGISADKTDSLFVLDPELISYPEDFISPFSFRSRDEEILNQSVVYDKHGDSIKIQLKDLIYLFDLPSGFSQCKMVKSRSGTKISNKLVSPSRIDGIKQTCYNTQDSLIAKNIVLKTNGKEMLSAKSGGFPLQGKEQREAETFVNQGYGLGWNRNRTLLTKSSLDWKSMHIAVRDLGLDESIKVDGNIIFTALMIPKDIMSIEAKKTTYNNFKESMTSFIQNEMVSMMNDFTSSINKYLLQDGLELVGNYDHLPVMGFVDSEKYGAVKMRAEALMALRQVGVPDDIALDLLGLESSMRLGELVQSQGQGDKGSDNKDSEKDAYEEYLKKLGIDDVNNR